MAAASRCASTARSPRTPSTRSHDTAWLRAHGLPLGGSGPSCCLLLRTSGPTAASGRPRPTATAAEARPGRAGRPAPGVGLTLQGQFRNLCPRSTSGGVAVARHQSISRSVAVYAIVRAGGRQEKVAVGDLVELDRIAGNPGDVVSLPVLLLVDNGAVTSDSAALSAASVKAELVDHHRGPKIDILRYKNKTGHRRRQGFRAQHTRVKITAISGAK